MYLKTSEMLPFDSEINYKSNKSILRGQKELEQINLSEFLYKISA